jgi:hypothetical protein
MSVYFRVQTTPGSGTGSGTYGRTGQLLVSNVVPVAIVALIDCTQILIYEDPSVAGWPTTAFWIMRPRSNSTSVTKFAGAVAAMQAPLGTKFTAGETVGWIQLPAVGSTTFDLEFS